MFSIMGRRRFLVDVFLVDAQHLALVRMAGVDLSAFALMRTNKLDAVCFPDYQDVQQCTGHTSQVC